MGSQDRVEVLRTLGGRRIRRLRGDHNRGARSRASPTLLDAPAGASPTSAGSAWNRGGDGRRLVL
eukprot:8230471-Alexandrium_andersonii.AAC.1